MYSYIARTPYYLTLNKPASYIEISSYKYPTITQTVSQIKKSFNTKNNKLSANLSDIQEIDLD
jgi:hypothetical protein